MQVCVMVSCYLCRYTWMCCEYWCKSVSGVYISMCTHSKQYPSSSTFIFVSFACFFSWPWPTAVHLSSKHPHTTQSRSCVFIRKGVSILNRRASPMRVGLCRRSRYIAAGRTSSRQNRVGLVLRVCCIPQGTGRSGLGSRLGRGPVSGERWTEDTAAAWSGLRQQPRVGKHCGLVA